MTYILECRTLQDCLLKGSFSYQSAECGDLVHDGGTCKATLEHGGPWERMLAYLLQTRQTP